jgi:hypothetical protein
MESLLATPHWGLTGSRMAAVRHLAYLVMLDVVLNERSWETRLLQGRFRATCWQFQAFPGRR